MANITIARAMILHKVVASFVAERARRDRDRPRWKAHKTRPNNRTHQDKNLDRKTETNGDKQTTVWKLKTGINYIRTI